MFKILIDINLITFNIFSHKTISTFALNCLRGTLPEQKAYTPYSRPAEKLTTKIPR